MTFKEKKQALQEELDDMRARLDRLRVKGSLGKMELRDKLVEFKKAMEPAYQKSKQTIADLTHGGIEESKTLAASLSAGWDELRKTYRDLSEESEQEHAEERKRKEGR